MMLNRKALKQLSKEQLKGNWGKAALATLILSFINIILELLIQPNNSSVNAKIATFSFSSILISLFALYSLLTQSFIFLKLTKEKDIKFSNLLISPKIYLKFIFFTLLIFIITIPIILFYIGLILKFKENFILIYVLGVLISLIFIIGELYISQIPFILVDSNKINILKVLKESLYLMQGNIFKLLILNLSFIGWLILNTLTGFIGSIFLLPYIFTTKANFYNELKKSKYEKTL